MDVTKRISKWVLAVAVVGMAVGSVSEGASRWPFVSGTATIGGEPAASEIVRIHQLGGPGSDCSFTADYVTSTNEYGHFYWGVLCSGNVMVAIKGESRTQFVSENTDFGVWELPEAVQPDVDKDGIRDSGGVRGSTIPNEQTLLQTYAPQLRLYQTDWCRPASVQWYLPRTHMRFTHVGCSDCGIVNHGGVTSTNITEQHHQKKHGWPGCGHYGQQEWSDAYSPGTHNKGFFLQQYNSTHSGCSDTHDWVVYGHVYPGDSGGIMVQYWFFYPYNDGFSGINHEGDWEFIAVALDEDYSVEALIYSQHENKITYGVDDVQWVGGTHPVVFSAKGSHACYAAYDGNYNCVGRNNPFDKCSPHGSLWNSWDKSAFGGIVNVGEKYYPFPGSNWVRFSGRWGEIGISEYTSGPKGPAYQWSSWHVWGGGEICDNEIDDDVDGTIDEYGCGYY